MRIEEYRDLMEAGRSEHDLQREVTRKLVAYMPPDVPWTAVDHAAKLSPRQAGERKRRGVKRGQADYRFILPPRGRSGEIELKRPKGGFQTPEQRKWQAEARAAGGLYVVCRSWGEVVATLMIWGVQLRDGAL